MSEGRGAVAGGAARGRCSGGQCRQTGLRRAGRVGQAVSESAVLVFERRGRLCHPDLGLLQKRPRLGAGLLALQTRVLLVLPLLWTVCGLVLRERRAEDGKLVTHRAGNDRTVEQKLDLRWES